MSTLERMRRILRAAIGCTTVVLVGLFDATAPAEAGQARIVTVLHPAISATLIPAGTAGPAPGDLRTYWTTLSRPGRHRTIGTMSGSLLTTAVGKPRSGYELRTADLVFTIGRPANQLVVGGIATYRQQAATLTRAESVVRPVVGGSGRFGGARGWCRSIHKPNGTWRHVFHIRVSPRTGRPHPS